MFLAGPKVNNSPASKLASNFWPFDPGIFILFLLVSFITFLNDFDDIIDCDEGGESEECNDTDKVYHSFYPLVARLSSYGFYKKEYQSSSVKCRQRQQVHNSEIGWKQYDHIQQRHESLESSSFVSRFFIYVSFNLSTV